jgi:hypothetical protein
MKERIIAEIRQALKDRADEKKIASSKHVFKEGEEALVYGVSIGEVNKIGKEFYNQIRDCSKKEMYDICEELWILQIYYLPEPL